VAASGVEAEVDEAGVELGTARREADVAHEGEVHARADGSAVDRGDGRQRRAAHAQEALVDRPEALALGLAEVAEVGARAERGRRAGDDDRPDPVVGLQAVERLDDVGDELVVQRVAALRVVQRDDRDALLAADLDLQQRDQSRTTAGE
jgi:hypothetical protein